MNEHKTLLWWRTLSALAIGNLLLWVAVMASVDTTMAYVRWHLVLSGIFTAVCAFRSFLPRIDLERYCLVDSKASSMVVGRSAATLAEVSFAGQVALLLHELGGAASVPWVQALAVPVVVVLTTAQIFCWSSVISLNHLGHAIEESLWALTFAVVGSCLAACAPQLEGTWRVVGFSGAVVCAVYVMFMVTVDVPMYVRRWRENRVTGAPRLGFREGWRDALNRRVVTRDWAIWKPEVAWLTGYFTAAVWVSLAMVCLPRG